MKGERAECVICGKIFKIPRSKTRTCSSECGRILFRNKPGEIPFGVRSIKLLQMRESQTQYRRSNPITKKVTSLRRRAMLLRENMDNTITAAQAEKIFDNQNGRCALSGLPITKETASPDHIIPVAHKGTTEASNIQFVHPSIQKLKMDLLEEELIKLCSAIHRHQIAKRKSAERES